MYSACELVNNTFICSYMDPAVAIVLPARSSHLRNIAWIIFRHFVLPFLYAYAVRVKPVEPVKKKRVAQPDWDNIDDVNAEIIGYLRLRPLAIDQLQTLVGLSNAELRARLLMLHMNNVVTKIEREEETVWAA